MFSKRACLLQADGGAVMVESIIAIPMLLAFFSAILQYSYLLMASLVVQHAAVVAARSASVIIPDDPTAYGDGSPVGDYKGERKSTIEDAARKPMQALLPMPFQTSSFDPNALTIEIEGAEGKDVFEPTGVAKVTVTFPYKCAVPFGGSLICGGDTKFLKAVAAMPIQGAEYAYY